MTKQVPSGAYASLWSLAAIQPEPAQQPGIAMGWPWIWDPDLSRSLRLPIHLATKARSAPGSQKLLIAVASPKDFQSGASVGRMKTSQDDAKMPNEYAEKFCPRLSGFGVAGVTGGRTYTNQMIEITVHLHQ